MNTELTDYLLAYADEYRNAMFPETAVLHRQNLTKVFNDLQQIVAMEILGEVAGLCYRNGYESRENVYRAKINERVLNHYGISDDTFIEFMRTYTLWNDSDPDKENTK